MESLMLQEIDAVDGNCNWYHAGIYYRYFDGTWKDLKSKHLSCSESDWTLSEGEELTESDLLILEKFKDLMIRSCRAMSELDKNNRNPYSDLKAATKAIEKQFSFKVNVSEMNRLDL